MLNMMKGWDIHIGMYPDMMEILAMGDTVFQKI